MDPIIWFFRIFRAQQYSYIRITQVDKVQESISDEAGRFLEANSSHCSPERASLQLVGIVEHAKCGRSDTGDHHNLQVGFGEVAPRYAGLIRNHHQPQSCLLENAQRGAYTFVEMQVLRPRRIVARMNQRSVAVEKESLMLLHELASPLSADNCSSALRRGCG
jgi:hypothetical protein